MSEVSLWKTFAQRAKAPAARDLQNNLLKTGRSGMFWWPFQDSKKFFGSSSAPCKKHTQEVSTNPGFKASDFFFSWTGRLG